MEKTQLAITENEYLNPEQLRYFKNRLITQKMEWIEKTQRHIKKIKTLRHDHADIIDRSNLMMDIDSEIRACERCRDFVKQIDRALSRIENGRFGYCEFTGDPIELGRLEALPFATLSMEAIEELHLRHRPVA